MRDEVIKVRRRKSQVLALGALCALLFFVTLMPAAWALSARVSAATGYATAHTTSTQRVVVCDHKPDTRDATAYYFRRGSSVLRSWDDENGVRAGCGRSPEGSRVTSLKVCFGSQYSTRCSPWS